MELKKITGFSKDGAAWTLEFERAKSEEQSAGTQRITVTQEPGDTALSLVQRAFAAVGAEYKEPTGLDAFEKWASTRI